MGGLYLSGWSGWVRLGLVLSLLWITYAVASVRWTELQFVEHAQTVAGLSCIDQARGKPSQAYKTTIDRCMRDATNLIGDDLREHHEGRTMLTWALAPLPFGWLLGFLAVLAGKWVWAGFVRLPKAS